MPTRLLGLLRIVAATLAPVSLLTPRIEPSAVMDARAATVTRKIAATNAKPGRIAADVGRIARGEREEIPDPQKKR